jgi:hypothetical protein
MVGPAFEARYRCWRSRAASSPFQPGDDLSQDKSATSPNIQTRHSLRLQVVKFSEATIQLGRETSAPEQGWPRFRRGPKRGIFRILMGCPHSAGNKISSLDKNKQKTSKSNLGSIMSLF